MRLESKAIYRQSLRGVRCPSRVFPSHASQDIPGLPFRQASGLRASLLMPHRDRGTEFQAEDKSQAKQLL